MRNLCANEQKGAEAGERPACSLFGRVLLLSGVAAFCVCLGLLELHRLRQGVELQRQLVVLQRRVALLEAAYPSDPEVVRSRRDVDTSVLRTVDGVPILRRPYGSRRRPPSQGLRIYETFLADASTQPTAPSVSYETDDPSIQPHHRSSAVFHSPRRFGRVNTNAVIAGDDYVRAASASAPPSELHRRSRAARGSPTAFVPRPSIGGAGSGHQDHHGRRQRCAAAHFEAHVSDINRESSSYGGSEGNGHLRNTNRDALFSDWRPADWMEKRQCGGEFQLYEGQVTVKQHGLYYLYAQINYREDHDVNGFEIQVNASSLIKCITMEIGNVPQKTSTCYTGAVTFIESGEAVSIRDLEPKRHSLMLPDRSFFGMLRLAG